MDTKYTTAVGPQLEELSEEEMLDIVGGNGGIEPYATPTPVLLSISVVSTALSSFSTGVVVSHAFNCQKD